jgi:hypothetical protein
MGDFEKNLRTFGMQASGLGLHAYVHAPHPPPEPHRPPVWLNQIKFPFTVDIKTFCFQLGYGFHHQLLYQSDLVYGAYLFVTLAACCALLVD